ncbi:hypothetical protein ACKWTF_010351 [Chironomus riparius]
MLFALFFITSHILLPATKHPLIPFKKISSQQHTQKKVFIHPISFLNLTSLILFVNKEHHLYHHPPFLSIHSFISSSWHELLSHEKSCDERTYNKKSTRWKLTGLLSSVPTLK